MSGAVAVQEQQKMTGRWLVPTDDAEAQAVLSLASDRTMRITLASVSARDRWQQLLAGEVISGTWTILGRARGGTFGRMASSSVGSASSSFLPGWLRAGLPPEPGTKGPFLVLTIRELPKSAANVRLLGVRLNLADYAVQAAEMSGGRYVKLMDLSTADEQISVITQDGAPQVWYRIR